MTTVFILAWDHGEATEIARLAGFKGSIGWAPLDERARGTRGACVLATSMDCWRSTRDFAVTTQMRDLMAAGDMKVTVVPCHLDWAASGYALPEGWNVPKVYPPLKDRIVMHKSGTGACDCGCGRQARGSFWSRLRRALAR